MNGTLVGNTIVDHSDVVGASPVGAAPNYFFILDLTRGFNGLGKNNHKTRRETFKFGDLVHLILDIWTHMQCCVDLHPNKFMWHLPTSHDTFFIGIPGKGTYIGFTNNCTVDGTYRRKTDLIQPVGFCIQHFHA